MAPLEFPLMCMSLQLLRIQPLLQCMSQQLMTLLLLISYLRILLRSQPLLQCMSLQLMTLLLLISYLLILSKSLNLSLPNLLFQKYFFQESKVSNNEDLVIQTDVSATPPPTQIITFTASEQIPALSAPVQTSDEVISFSLAQNAQFRNVDFTAVQNDAQIDTFIATPAVVNLAQDSAPVFETLLTETIPIETIPTETLPTETIPTETIPTETLPTETIPTETIPTETLTP